METEGNYLVDRDRETNAIIPVLQDYSHDMENKEVNGNYLVVRDRRTNAIVPVVKISSGNSEAQTAWGGITGEIENQADLKNELDEIRDIALGAHIGIVFDNKAQLDAWIAGTYTRPDSVLPDNLKTGESIYIRATDEPDYWWDGTQYFEQETKTDLSDYYNKEEVDDAIEKALQASLADDPASSALPSTGTFANILQTVRNCLKWMVAQFNTDTGHNHDGVNSREVAVNKMWVPDYANMETTNRISTNSGSWIVERTGFVCVSSEPTSEAKWFTVYINNNIAWYGNSGAWPTRYVVPVAAGDTVTINVGVYSGSATIQCFFVPPRLVSIES